jgi:hypothetical protein
MKLTTSILVLGLAPMMWAQAGPAPINAARNAAAIASANTQRTNAVLENKAATQPTSTPAQHSAPAKPQTLTTAANVVPPMVKKSGGRNLASAVQKDLDKPSDEAKSTRAQRRDRRDPFVSVIRSDSAGPGNPCLSGKKCLAVNEIVLRGIVKSQNAVIAVVENPEKKTYFLRENDPVLNGEVVKITGDAVVFHERSTDKLGRVNTKEITKHVDTRPIA